MSRQHDGGGGESNIYCAYFYASRNMTCWDTILSDTGNRGIEEIHTFSLPITSANLSVKEILHKMNTAQ